MSTIGVNNFRPSGGGTSFSHEGIDKVLLRYTQVTPIINSSTNVTSVTDTAAGQFTVNYTNIFNTALGINPKHTNLSDTSATTTAFGGHIPGTSKTNNAIIETGSCPFQTYFTNATVMGLDDYISIVTVSGDLA